jgi:hypothetical protein
MAGGPQENEGAAAHALVFDCKALRVAAGIEGLDLVDNIVHGRATAGNNAPW